MNLVDYLWLAIYVGFLYWVATTKFDPRQAMLARLSEARESGKLNTPVRHEKSRDKRSGN